MRGKGKLAVVCAGTSDIPVAEEAQVTAEVMGNEVESIYDVGVAGIHRLMAASERLADSARHRGCGGDGRRAAERGRRNRLRAGDRRAHQRRLRREFPGISRAARHAE